MNGTIGCYLDLLVSHCKLCSQVTSKKDQEQYWSDHTCAYRYVPVDKFVEAFRFYTVGSNLCRDLFIPFNRWNNHPAALSTSSYGVSKWELFKIGYSWHRLLMKRNSFIYVFKFIQVLGH